MYGLLPIRSRATIGVESELQLEFLSKILAQTRVGRDFMINAISRSRLHNFTGTKLRGNLELQRNHVNGSVFEGMKWKLCEIITSFYTNTSKQPM